MNFCMYALVFVTPPDIDLLRFVAQRFTESFSEEANHDRLVPGGGGIWTSFVDMQLSCQCEDGDRVSPFVMAMITQKRLFQAMF